MRSTKLRCGFRNMCLQCAWSLFRTRWSASKMHGFLAKTRFSSSFCSHPTTVLCQRFYEGSEDEEPECGMEMVLVALGDWLRLSTDANTPLCFSLCISLKSEMIFLWPFATVEQHEAVRPTTESVTVHVYMSLIAFYCIFPIICKRDNIV